MLIGLLDAGGCDFFNIVILDLVRSILTSLVAGLVGGGSETSSDSSDDMPIALALKALLVLVDGPKAASSRVASATVGVTFVAVSSFFAFFTYLRLAVFSVLIGFEERVLLATGLIWYFVSSSSERTRFELGETNDIFVFSI